MRYIISYPNPRETEDAIRRYITIHYKKYNKNQVVLLLKLILPSNR